VPFRASEDLGYDAPPLLVLLALIHRSAWKWNSQKLNFRFTEFSEVRTAPVLHRAVFLCTGQGDIVIHT
jgi:hypothetical protein